MYIENTILSFGTAMNARSTARASHQFFHIAIKLEYDK